MDAQQALQILDQAVSTINTDRKNHVLLQQAVEVLKEAIQPRTASEEKKE